MNRRIIVICLSVFACISLFSQSNEYLDEVLESGSISVADTAYIIFLSKDPALEAGGVEMAKTILADRYGLDPDTATTAMDIAALCVNEYGIPRGLMYSITKASRYAYRDMQFAGYLKGISDPAAVLSPEDALHIISQCQADWSDKQ